jgi:leader peptidase (prepilin peptidase)/N-methyltransferase
VFALSTSASSLDLLFAASLGVLGLMLGSFLNVVIARVPCEMSIVRPRSRCPRCGHELPWYENIPLFSWLLLQGKCSACRAPISWRYPLVELLTGLLFLACLGRFGWTWELVPPLMLVTLLIPLTFIDLEHWLLPFSLTIPGIALGVSLSIPLGVERLRDSALGAVIGFLGFWALEHVGRRVFKKEALGGGDKYLLAMIGAFLTYRALLAVVFLASLQGALVGTILLVLFGRAGPAPPVGAEPEQRASESPPQSAPDAATGQSPKTSSEEEDDWRPGPTNLPFGPWLALGALEVMLFGPRLAELIPWRAVQLLFAGG